jgi:hypothetical protein
MTSPSVSLVVALLGGAMIGRIWLIPVSVSALMLVVVHSASLVGREPADLVRARSKMSTNIGR